MASRSLLGGTVTGSCRLLFPVKKLTLRSAPVFLSSFLGEKPRSRCTGLNGTSSRSGSGSRLRIQACARRRSGGFMKIGDRAGGPRDTLPLSGRSVHLGIGKELSFGEKAPAAQADVAVAADRQSVATRERSQSFPGGSGHSNSLFGFARMEDELSGGEDEDGEILRDASNAIDEDELAIANLGVAQEIVDALVKRGITQLFPIQRAVLSPAMQGKDLIGRAKTGTGKTLAFGMPIVDRIIRENKKNRFARMSGRNPRALILAPTRELAKQVEKELMETAPSLSTICVYGGVSITGQQRQLQRGVDIAVGTPGRVIDLIERRSLNLQEVQVLVLDEADQMLAVGFEEDVEQILESLPSERQSLLFSATMPAWVKKLSRKYLKNPLTVDLVGDADEKLAEGIKLMAVQIVASAKRSILNDLITVYAKGEKTIVFTQTKRDADEVALSMSRMVGCEALHGDITQAQREKTLNAFRDGRFSVLVATDVAARGLDIPNVDLVVHYEIPNDPETFVHRSGRTGRAGKAGTAVLMYTASQSRTMKLIERDVGATFKKVPPPSVEEVLSSSSDQAQELIKNVHPDLVETFLPTAEKLLVETGPGALAAAIAHLSGFSQPPASRSLITFEQGIVTLRIVRTSRSRGGRLISARAVMGTLADIFPAAADQVGKIKIIDENDVEGAVFDLPEDVAKELMLKPQIGGDVIDVPKVLPRIWEEDSRGRTDSYGRFSTNGRGGRGGGSYGRNDRDDRKSSGRSGAGRFEDKTWGRGFDMDEDRRGGVSPRFDSRGDRNGRPSTFSGTCYICGQAGHRAVDCPKGRRR